MRPPYSPKGWRVYLRHTRIDHGSRRPVTNCWLIPMRRRSLDCLSWPAFAGRMQSPRYVHSKLSLASDDSERSSVRMPAECNADSSFGRIPGRWVNMYERFLPRCHDLEGSIPACVLPSCGERVIMTSISPHVALPLHTHQVAATNEGRG